MGQPMPLRCRVAACNEPASDGLSWHFYLINDSDVAFDVVTMERVVSEWGDMSHTEAGESILPGLAPGKHVLLWRDDGELRVEVFVRVVAGGREARSSFEFPRLYRRKELPLVEGLGKPGVQVASGKLD
jgi:hypothetical protein